MRKDGLMPLGYTGGAVEADETFLWEDPQAVPDRGMHGKHKILSLIDRRSGAARSIPIENLKASTVLPVLKQNIAEEAKLITDDAATITT